MPSSSFANFCSYNLAVLSSSETLGEEEVCFVFGSDMWYAPGITVDEDGTFETWKFLCAFEIGEGGVKILVGDEHWVLFFAQSVEV